MDFFYSGQIRRYLLQIIRVFSDLKIEETRNGAKVTERVPILYGDPSKMVAQILKGNSENTVMPTPMMSLWIQDIVMAPERRQDPMWVGTENIVERKYEEGSGYTAEIGNQYTLKRYMPVPYTLKVQLDIWTTSTTTKLQLLEQICTWFNDRLQLQQNTNIYDWTSIFEIIMTNVSWSSRSIPQGAAIERDVASIEFDVPIWLNPPAKLQSKKWIEQIVTNIKDISGLSDKDIDTELDNPLGCFSDLSQVIVTPDNIRLSVIEENGIVSATLLETDYDWHSLLDAYNIEPENVTLHLKTNNNIESEDGDIYGTISINENDAKTVTVTLDTDTVPADTISISPITDIINPLEKYPGSGLPAAQPGQKYLILSDTSHPYEPAIRSTNGPWGPLIAYNNDIIEYNGDKWIVVFDSRNSNDEVFVTNLSDLQKYKFSNGEWIYLYYGEFNPGYWRIFGTKS